jgi:hypothetical protein
MPSIVKKLQGLKEEAEYPGNELSQAVDGLKQAVERLSGFVPRDATIDSSLRVSVMLKRLQQMHLQVADMVEDLENEELETGGPTDAAVAHAHRARQSPAQDKAQYGEVIHPDQPSS